MNTTKTDIYDADGFDEAGYNEEGYNRDGKHFNDNPETAVLLTEIVDAEDEIAFLISDVHEDNTVRLRKVLAAIREYTRTDHKEANK